MLVRFNGLSPLPLVLNVPSTRLSAEPELTWNAVSVAVGPPEMMLPSVALTATVVAATVLSDAFARLNVMRKASYSVTVSGVSS